MRQTRTGGMVELTLLEVHVDVDDSEFSAAADAYAPGEKDVEAGGTPPDGDGDDGGSGRAAVGAIVGLVFAVVVAYAARRQFGTGDGDGGDGDGNGDGG